MSHYHSGHPLSLREFRNDDTGYRAWLAAYPDGYVINIGRSYNANTARLHHARCNTINGQSQHGGALTGQYVKVCGEHKEALEQWASDHVPQPIRPCGSCHPARCAVRPASTKQPQQSPAAPLPAGRSRVRRTADSTAVEAWADDYIRFERLPDWQKRLRSEIRTCCAQLEPPVDQVLHASYFGVKKLNADVENLLLYCIDSFKIAGRNGIRFEHGAVVPPAADGAVYPFGYRYALAPRTGAFKEWRQRRTLASFDWTDLGSFAGDKKAAQVWFALARGDIETYEPARMPETPFALKIHVRPPHGRQPVWGGLVKGVFDGAICALQAHSDMAVLSEVAARLATMLPAPPAEIEERLLDQHRAVLGVVQRLVYPYRKGVKWDPADHLCVAGELLGAEPVNDRWAVRGELVELSR